MVVLETGVVVLETGVVVLETGVVVLVANTPLIELSVGSRYNGIDAISIQIAIRMINIIPEIIFFIIGNTTKCEGRRRIQFIYKK